MQNKPILFIDEISGLEMAVSVASDNVIPSRLSPHERQKALVNALQGPSQWRSMTEQEASDYFKRLLTAIAQD